MKRRFVVFEDDKRWGRKVNFSSDPRLLEIARIAQEIIDEYDDENAPSASVIAAWL